MQGNLNPFTRVEKKSSYPIKSSITRENFPLTQTDKEGSLKRKSQILRISGSPEAEVWSVNLEFTRYEFLKIPIFPSAG